MTFLRHMRACKLKDVNRCVSMTRIVKQSGTEDWRGQSAADRLTTDHSRSRSWSGGGRTFSTFGLLARAKSGDDITSLFTPVPLKPSETNPDDINVGEELTGKLNKDSLIRILNLFYKRAQVKRICEENGLDNRLFHQSFVSFRRYCLESDSLPVDLHIVCSDILQKAGHVDDLLPYFLAHARTVFPHLACMDDLKKISDIRLPANWYPEARAINRKIIFHAGPTNSGKTFHALQRFNSAKSGLYCGPLKLLAVEVHGKTNAGGTVCDLVTGEERRYANTDRSPASHVACTVEMASTTTTYEVAVIDEIQMMRDQGRGWAWTRALLGIAANEIHLCGEAAAVELVKELCLQIGETVEVCKYKRLTSLVVEERALETLKDVQPGDCIVCFNKNDIYHVSRQLERLGREVAVIYGGLPPGTKLGQARKFNDPQDPCKILVATDAIGMGLNLSIRRVIFYSLIKPTINEKGEKEMDTISTSQALQIAGRAGRYGTQYANGFVTTFKREDLHMLNAILNRPVDEIEVAGLHPTADQIELFAYHLPHATLSNLIEIFVSLCKVNHSLHFMCNIDDFKFLADMIQHVPLPLRARYAFCCAPINRKMPFVCTMFLKFARQYSKNELATLDWLCQNISWPFSLPQTIVELVHLEAVFDVLDLYLWLSYRFQDLFPDGELVRDMQHELDEIIQVGVANITKLLRNSESGVSSFPVTSDEDSFTIKRKTESYAKGQKLLNPTKPNLAEQIILERRPRGNLEDESSTNGEEDGSGSFPSQKYLTMMKERAASVGLDLPTAKYGQGKLASRLVAQGLLTPKLLSELKREWELGNKHSKRLPHYAGDEEDQDTSTTDDSTPKRKPKL